MMGNDLSQSYLKSILNYDARTGIFTWKARPLSHFKNEGLQKRQHTRWADKPAGHIDISNGYVKITIDGRDYRAHRLAWLYEYGNWPSEFIDHKNMDRADNRLSNIREANRSQNGMNRNARSAKFKGVSRGYGGKYQARIGLNGKDRSLGYFVTPEEASVAYGLAAEKYHGEFART